MQERPQNFDAMGEDPEATLVTPRFDAEEARRAEPVVPLAETDTRAPFVNAAWLTRRGPRRSWATALLAVVLLAAVAAGGVLATKVLRRSQTNAPAQTEAAPAPAQTADVPQPKEAPPAQQTPREEAHAKSQARAPREREAEGAMIVAPAAILRGAVEDADEKDDEHRARGREKRRGHDDDDEKEMRKAPKRPSKGKAARLVDVLTGP